MSETTTRARSTACATCGNEYDKAFRVETAAGESFWFDSIECASARIAPKCAHCGCTVLGHGVESPSDVFCCAHCAEQVGEDRLVDRAQ